MTLYGHYIKYGPKCSDHIRSVIPLLGTLVPQPVTSPPRSLPFAHTNRPSNPAADVVRRPTPPASPESWRPHVQTARPSEHSFSREYFLRETRGPRICVFHTPRPSHTRADPLAVSKHRFRQCPAVRAKRNRRHHNHRRIELCRDALPVVPQLPQNHTIDRRTDITLLEVRAPPQAVPAPWLPPPPRERDPLVNSSLFRVQSRRFESFAYLFTAIACSSKCPPRSSAPAPINSRAGKSVVVK